MKLLLFCAITFLSCSLNVSDSGSGTNVGNAIVLGIIHDQNGMPVSNTRVLLLPNDFNPIANPKIDNRFIDTTDSNGLYAFSIDDTGAYNIEAEHNDDNTKLLIQNINVAENSTVTVPTEMLKRTGAVRVGLPGSLKEGYIYIPGTTLKLDLQNLQIINDTLIIHSIPAGIMPVINHVPSTNVNDPTPIATEVSITPDDTTNTETEFTPNEILFSETFDDTGFVGKGWYDDAHPILSAYEHIDNSIRSLEYKFLQGDTLPVGSSAMRHLFTETDSVYISFHVKYSSNWQGSNQYSGASPITLVTNVDDVFVGPWYNSLAIHLQQDAGVPLVYLTDPKNIDASNIDVDLTDITENRAVAGCNGDSDGYGPGECYQGLSYHSNYKPFKKGNKYFQDNPGKYYKNEWHFIELYVKLNSISNGKGIADGVIKYWYDGELVMNYDHVMLRTAQHTDMKFNQLVMAPSVGVSPIDQTMWIDELVIGR